MRPLRIKVESSRIKTMLLLLSSEVGRIASSSGDDHIGPYQCSDRLVVAPMIVVGREDRECRRDIILSSILSSKIGPNRFANKG